MLKQRLIVILMVVVAIAGSASLLTTRQEPQPLLELVLIEPMHSVYYAPQYVALHMNYFSDEGLDVRVKIARGEDTATAALLEGTAQIGLFSAEQSINALTGDGEPSLQAFALLCQRDGACLMERRQNTSSSWPAATGKLIVSDAMDLVLQSMLQQHGIRPHVDVQIKPYSSPAATAKAFAQGTGDYAKLFEPYSTELLEAGTGTVVLPLAEQTGNLPLAVYHTTNQMVKEQPEMLQGFADAIYRSQMFVQSHTAAEIAAVIAPSFPDLDRELLTKAIASYQALGVWSNDPVLEPVLFDHMQEAMVRAGKLEQRVNSEGLINTIFAARATQSRR